MALRNTAARARRFGTINPIRALLAAFAGQK
jgi:hypothetical protein